MFSSILKVVLLTSLSAGLFISANAAPIKNFAMELFVDNDFAVFEGTATGVNGLLYQNNVVWYTQATSLSTLSFSLSSGNDTLYVLAMDGGGITGFGGKLNGVNITDSSIDVSVSNNISSFLTGYAPGSVTNGYFNVTLADVSSAFGSGLIWNNSPTIASTNVVSPIITNYGQGFVWGVNEAVLYQFSASELDIETTGVVSEPALLGLFGLALVGLRRFKKK